MLAGGAAGDARIGQAAGLDLDVTAYVRISKEIQEFASGKSADYQPEKPAMQSPGVGQEGMALLVRRGERAACHSDRVPDQESARAVQQQLLQTEP